MPIETRSRDGRYQVVHRRRAPGVGSGLLGSAPALLGFALSFAPVFLTRPQTGVSLAGLVALQILIVAAGLKLLAEASRRERVVTTLLISPGEVEVRLGRGPFALTRAFGAVETDRFRLSRVSVGDAPLFSLVIVPVIGSPVPVVPADPDEGAVRDAALVLSGGMGAPLDDVRYAAPGSAAPPARVARSGDDERTVLSWSYRDRFRPRASMLALGVVAALSAAMPGLVGFGLLLVPVVVADLFVALSLVVHALVTLSERRVVLRPESVRVERFLGGIPLTQRLVLFREIKAVLVLRRGPLATLHVRVEGGGRAAALPFEDPGVAGWLKLTIDREAHRAGERAAASAGRAGG
jgi:hypothetical protein